MEFDYVPLDTLEALATNLRRSVPVDTFAAPPIEGNDRFWQRAAEASGLDMDAAVELAEDVDADFSSREFHLVSEHPHSLWVGDLCSIESRLAVRTLGIKGICTVASHAIDGLWAADGVAYQTAVVTPTQPLSASLEKCVQFLTSHSPAVVCCSSGIGGSAVVAAAFLLATQPHTDAVDALELVRHAAVHGGRLDVSDEDIDALQAFADTRPPLPPIEIEPVDATPAAKGKALQRQETTTATGKRKRADMEGIGPEPPLQHSLSIEM